MSDLLERHASTTERRVATGPPPPTATPPDDERAETPWPRGARMLVAVLAAATLIAGVGAIIAVVTEDGSDQVPSEVDELTIERDRLVADQAELTAERDRLVADQAELTAERDQLVADQAELTAERDQLSAERGELATRVATLDIELTATRTEVTRLTDQMATLEGERDALQIELAATGSLVTDLERQLGAAIDQTATLDERIAVLDDEINDLLVRAFVAERARDELAAAFPVTFDSTVDDIALTGTWDVDWTEAYCDGFATCGAVPGFEVLAIRETGEGWLRVEIDGVLDAGLHRVDGALYGIGPSRTAAPACDGTQRAATVSLTIYPHGVRVTGDGDHEVTDLGISMLVQAAPTPTCPAGTAFYGGSLTPR